MGCIPTVNNAAFPFLTANNPWPGDLVKLLWVPRSHTELAKGRIRCEWMVAECVALDTWGYKNVIRNQ